MPLGSIVAEYDRLGGLCPGDFIKKWWNAAAGSWIYPEQNGFQLDVSNTPIRKGVLHNSLHTSKLTMFDSLYRGPAVAPSWLADRPLWLRIRHIPCPCRFSLFSTRSASSEP